MVVILRQRWGWLRFNSIFNLKIHILAKCLEAPPTRGGLAGCTECLPCAERGCQRRTRSKPIPRGFGTGAHSHADMGRGQVWAPPPQGAFIFSGTPAGLRGVAVLSRPRGTGGPECAHGSCWRARGRPSPGARAPLTFDRRGVAWGQPRGPSPHPCTVSPIPNAPGGGRGDTRQGPACPGPASRGAGGGHGATGAFGQKVALFSGTMCSMALACVTRQNPRLVCSQKSVPSWPH